MKKKTIKKNSINMSVGFYKLLTEDVRRLFLPVKKEEVVMNIKPLGVNQTLLITNHGDEVLFSYETAVAGFSPQIGLFKTSEKCSNTTIRHINKYIEGREAVVLSYKQIEDMFL